MYRIKTLAEVSRTEEKVVYSAVMQQLVDDEYVDPAEGEEISAELTWFIPGHQTSAIPANTTQADTAVRELSGQRVYDMPDIISITDASDLDQIKVSPIVVAGVVNSAGAALSGSVSYQDDDSTTVDVASATGRIDIYTLPRTLRTVLKSQLNGNVLLFTGSTLGVYGWIRDGRTVGQITGVKYSGGSTQVQLSPAGVQSSQLLLSTVDHLEEVPLVAGTRELLIGTGFPFQILDCNGNLVEARTVTSLESCRVDVTSLSTKIFIVVPTRIESLWSYLGGAPLVSDPELVPEAGAETLSIPLYAPAATVVLGKVYIRTATTWVLANASTRSNQIAKLWMARGTSVGISGMVAEGVVTNPAWAFTAAQYELPLYLTGSGEITLVKPTETLAPGIVARVVGYVRSANSIYFNGTISVAVPKTVVFDPGEYEAGAETILGRVYRRATTGGWTLANVDLPAFALVRLFMALGDVPEEDGMISEGDVVNPAWVFTAEQQDLPVYLTGAAGEVIVVVPNTITNPGEVARVVGFVNGTDSIHFNGNLPGGVLKGVIP